MIEWFKQRLLKGVVIKRGVGKLVAISVPWVGYKPQWEPVTKVVMALHGYTKYCAGVMPLESEAQEFFGVHPKTLLILFPHNGWKKSYPPTILDTEYSCKELADALQSGLNIHNKSYRAYWVGKTELRKLVNFFPPEQIQGLL